MAQIIKHRRGSLESVSSATKRAGELLVVTGSAGITAGNGDSILFVGIDGSTVTPANKFLLGASAPDLTGASYDTSVDGIPFYDTGSEKLYILRKGGNLEVKATANTNGTGIVSSSAQIDALGFLQVNGDSVVSGSSQITISSTTGYASFSSSLASTDAAQDIRITALETFSSSLGDGFATDAELQAVSAAFDTTIGSLTTDDISEGSNLYYTDARVKTKLNAETVVSSSAQISNYGVFAELNGDNLVSSSAQISAYNTFLEINGDGVHSGSAQVVSALLNQATDFGSGRVSGDNFGDAAGTSTFTGSFVGDGSQLTGLVTDLRISGSTGNDVVSLLTDDLSIVGTANEIETTVTNNQIQIGLVTDPTLSGNVTITGDLEVQGTTTTVNSTTIELGDNIIELNGSGAVNGGLLVKDVTAPNTLSGSLLWDSTNDYWKAGALGAESKILLAGGDGVVSGSAQIDLSGVTGDTDDVTEGVTNLYFTDARVKTKLNAEGVLSGSAQITAGSGIVSSSAQISSYGVFAELNGDNLVSSSAQVSAYGVFAELNGDNLVSSSAQISSYGVFAELNGDNLVSSSAQVVSLIDSQNVNLGGISGSTLDITGNAKIDGNLVLGGNITIGDATSDTISFGGQVSSDIIPDPSNTYDLGSATNKFAEAHATNFYGTINGVVNATNGVISGSSQLDGTTLGASSGIVATGSFNGTFVGDGSGLTGLATDLTISGSTGNDTLNLLNDDLTFAGGTAVSAAVTNNTVTYSVQDASTSQKGISSFDADDFSVASGNVSIKSGGVRAANLNADVAGTGISLNGADNSIEVDYGSTAGTAVEGNTTITVQGTANEIEITGTAAQALGGGASYTIGLPNDVTIGNDLTVTTDASVGGNLTVTGNLSVLGTTTTVDSTTVQIGDNILELNYGGAQTTAGLQVTDATAPNTVSGSLLWDGTNDYWMAGALGSEKELARLNASPTSNTVLKADANGLLVDSLITDDGTNVTISGTAELRINAATANSFVYFDANKSLEAVTPSNAGDVIQWNGSSFIASNELDGGTF